GFREIAGAVYLAEVLNRGSNPGNAFETRRAGHPAVGNVIVGRPNLVGREFFETLAFAPENADVWAEEFVCRANKIRAAPLLYVHPPMRREVDGIQERLCSGSASQVANLLCWIDCSHGIRGAADGHEQGFIGQLLA